MRTKLSLTEEFVLFSRITKLSDESFDIDRLDLGVTLTKISQEQRDDLAGMIDFLDNEDWPEGSILGQVMHDTYGLKAEILEGPCGFSPRSHGYAKKVEDNKVQALKKAGVNIAAAGM